MRQGLNDKWRVFAGTGLTPMVAEASLAVMLKSPLAGAGWPFRTTPSD
jgi:hypothetical protein